MLILMKDSNGRKAGEPDEVTGWILRECKKQTADRMHEVINTFSYKEVPMV